MSQQRSGYLDPVDGLLVRGWAIADDPEATAFVDILIDGELVTRLAADSYRADLDEAGFKQGFAAFFLEMPAKYRDGHVHELDARYSGTERSLADSPAVFRIEPKGHASLAERRRWAARHLVYGGATGRLGESVARTRRLAILSTYHEASQHLGYHRDILSGLTEAGFTVLVVHAADTHRPGIAETNDPNVFTVLKRNIGYDFGSYAVGVFAACDHFGRLDELVMTNDSIVQIADGLGDVISRFRAVGADVVSCTDSFEHRYHLQSYMLWFRAGVLASGCLQRFMADYSFTSRKDDVIAEGELGLSRMLQSEGFAIAALFPYQAVASAWIGQHAATTQAIRDLPGLPASWPGASFKKALLERLDLILERLLHGAPVNPSHFFWDTLVDEFDCPFVKRELILVNPCNVPTYFKLGRYFPADSAAFDALTEIRHRYGGHLVAPSIGDLGQSSADSGATAGRLLRDGNERVFRVVQGADFGGKSPQLAHQDATRT